MMLLRTVDTDCSGVYYAFYSDENIKLMMLLVVLSESRGFLEAKPGAGAIVDVYTLP